MTTLTVQDTKEPAGDGGLLRVRARLGYDGTAFHGWARQPGLRTVQGDVEAALATVLRLAEPARTVCAGRTDAGVHARDQHLHVDLPASRWPGDGAVLQRRLNGLLAADVRVHEVALAPAGFDARFSVLNRRYVYRVDDCGEADPLHRAFVVGHPRPLDLSQMNLAAAVLLGEHDFASFCRHRAEATTVRTLQQVTWRRSRNGVAVLTVQADAFCHSMVRSLVGAMLAVGDGRQPVAWLGAVLASRRRTPAVVVAPAHGLVLDQVSYAEDVAGQAHRARRMRG